MQNPRIAIDGYNLALARGTGVATYGFTLAAVLKEQGNRVEGVFGVDIGRDPAQRELLFFDRLGKDQRLTRRQRRWRRLSPLRAAISGPTLLEVPLTDQIERAPLAERLPEFDRLWSGPDLFGLADRYFRLFGRFLPIHMAEPPAIMHWTYPLPIKLANARNVYTLHDLVPLRLPFTTLDEKRHYHAIIDGCMQWGDRICTVSETSRADIASRYPMHEGKIVNTYQCASIPDDVLGTNPEEHADLIKGLFGFERDGYFLYFGAVDPKKNLGRLIEAYLGTRIETPLVIVGGRDWGTEDRLKDGNVNIFGHVVDKRIVRLDYLPRRLLFRLVRGARAVLFPSLYEGFGLPALEAMSLGAPVIGSTGGALPEVIGDAGLLVDPYDVSALAESLRVVDVDAELRNHLRARGLARATQFAPDRYATRLNALYAPLLRQGMTG